MTTPFVGREGELVALAADLDTAVAGRGGVVLLGGEPGIGKARLAEELATQATSRGALVLWGRCWEGEGAPAFWPWVQVVRAYVEGSDPAALLGGLDRREVASFVALVAGVEPSPELTAALHRETDGNPFFVTEVVRLLTSQGRLDRAGVGSSAGLPEGVRAVVAERLGRLSDGCQRVLEVAAVLGRHFELRALQPASGLDPGRLLELLEEAEAARVVVAVPEELGRWRFAHALVREVLYESVPAARRIRLHGRVGEGAGGRLCRRSGAASGRGGPSFRGCRPWRGGGQGGAGGHPGRASRLGVAGLGGGGGPVRARPGRAGASRAAGSAAAL